jgi:hypothetical protein
LYKTSLVSPPYAPAFINTAPPVVPGIPHENSSPVIEWSAAKKETSIILEPLCAITVFPSILMVLRFKVEITIPLIPPSLIIKLEPLPNMKVGIWRSKA